MQRYFALLFVAVLSIGNVAKAGEVRVGVAANFRATANDLADAFKLETGHSVRLSTASTGILFAQISRGAPLDVFLSADQMRPAKLVEAGIAVAGSRYTYATGRLVFISSDPAMIGPGGPDLDALRTLSIANPATAPYGAAAAQALTAMGRGTLRIAQAQNAAGVVAAVSSGAADGGFTALSLTRASNEISTWQVPVELHDPIRQDVVLLTRAASNIAAGEFHAWLRSAAAKQIIRSQGYDVD